jgi:hypothetical protein
MHACIGTQMVQSLSGFADDTVFHRVGPDVLSCRSMQVIMTPVATFPIAQISDISHRFATNQIVETDSFKLNSVEFLVLPPD